MAKSEQFCTFFLEGSLFGVPVPQVQEVIRFQEMTRVPLAPKVVAGMINLRGQIVIAIDLRRKLSLSARKEGSLPVNVVVCSADGVVSLMVDEIGDVVEVEQATFEAPPETLQGAARSMILGVHKLEGRLMHMLDTETVCQVSASTEPTSAER
jgi:purine-binding chemotaxis protein CheW